MSSEPAPPVIYDIAIVGGGMVGLSLWQLLRHYLPEASVCLVESQPLADNAESLNQPSFDQRSTALSSSSADIFRDLGLWSGIVQRATPILNVHVSDRGHIGMSSYGVPSTASRPFQKTADSHNGVSERDIPGFVVENRWLGTQLSQGLNRGAIFAPADVKTIRLVRDGAAIQVALQEKTIEIHAQLVVIADGAESSLREQLGIGVDRHDYQQSAVIANVAYAKSHGGVAYERFTENGPLALLPLGGSSRANTSALVWTQPDTKIDTVMQWSDDEFLANLQTMFGYRLGEFVQVGKRAHYSLQRVVAKEQVRSSVVLMGNAAHFLHPVAGQGFNLALRDCAQLVSVLQRAFREKRRLGALAVLQEYARLQEKDQWATIGLSHQVNRIFTTSHPLPSVLRNLGLVGLEFCAPAKKSFFAQMMGKGNKKIEFA